MAITTTRAGLARPSPRPQRDGRPSLIAYVVVAGLVSIPLAVQTIRTDWSTDVWQHAAAILELSNRPLDPHHPTVAATVGHPDLSPYSLVWGLIHRVIGADVLTILVVAGLVNLVAFWVGLWVFATRLTRARLAPAFTVLAVLLVWGFRPWRWSGYPSFNSLGFGLPYPSIAALVGYLVALALFLDWLEKPRWSRAWVIGAIGAVVVVIHPITGAALALGVVSLLAEAAWRRGFPPRATFVQLAIPAAVALALVLVWPFYEFGSLFDNAGSYAAANQGVLRNFLPRAALGFVCLPVAVVLARRRGDWRLVALALPPLFLAVTGVARDLPGLGRFLPFGLLPLQIALADVVAGAVPRSAPLRGTRLALGAVFAALGLIGVARAFAHMVPDPLLPPSARNDYRLVTARDDAARSSHLDDEMVVIAPEPDVAWTALSSGAKLVVTPHGAPEIADGEARLDAVATYLTLSPREQRGIAERYGATHVVLSGDAARALDDLRALGTVEWVGDGVVVVRVT
jgi:hypothetical protein